MKTSELQGAALDWAVHIAQGLSEEDFVIVDSLYGPQWRGPEYSTSWQEGGPIIERELNDLFKLHGRVGDPPVWCAAKHVHRDGHTALLSLTGPTPLIAAMRCFVASRLGDEVYIPEELK
jgi:hypothetical protein